MLRRIRTALVGPVRARSLIGASAAALVLTAPTALAGSGVGGTFNLGQTNTVDASSVLTGSSAGELKVQNNSTASGAFSVLGLINPSTPGSNSVALRGQNNGTGAAGYGVWGSQAGSGTGVYGIAPTGIGVYGKHTGSTGNGAGVKGESVAANVPGLLGLNSAGGPALGLVVNSGKAPFTVNSGVKVTNLNADLLDGFDGSAFWKTAGNAGTNPASNFVGTTDAQPLVFKTNGSEAMRVDAAGNVGIGTDSPTEKLHVDGNIRAGTLLGSEGFEDASFPPAGWTTGGAADWTRTTSSPGEGSAAAASGNTVQDSWLSTTAVFPRPGTIRFLWRLDAASLSSLMMFCRDGSAPGSCSGAAYSTTIAGPNSWREVAVPVPAGSHTFTWSAVTSGGGQGFLDAVSFESDGDVTATGYVAVRVVSGSAPSSSDCDEAAEAGRLAVRLDGSTNLYICLGAGGWAGK